MGILCILCRSKEEDNINDDNKNNDKLDLKIENKSPEIIMNINPIKESDRNIIKEEKKAKFYKSNEYDIKSSKTQTNLLNFKKDNNVEKIVTKLIYNNHEINEEEG